MPDFTSKQFYRKVFFRHGLLGVAVHIPTDNAEGFKEGAKLEEAGLSKQAEGTLLKTPLC